VSSPNPTRAAWRVILRRWVREAVGPHPPRHQALAALEAIQQAAGNARVMADPDPDSPTRPLTDPYPPHPTPDAFDLALADLTRELEQLPE
jgi:hypothetical protein